MIAGSDAVVEIAGIKKYLYEDNDRHGNPRLYFRKRIPVLDAQGRPIKSKWKFRKVRLRETPGTPEFAVEFCAARDGRPYTKGDTNSGNPHRPTAPPRHVIANSLRWIIGRYYKESAEFLAYDEETKKARRNILRALCDEPVTEDEGCTQQVGDLPYEIPSEKIEVLRDRKARSSIDAANARVKAIRKLYDWARSTKPTKLIARNIAKDVDLLKRIDKGGHHTWTIPEIELFIKRHPPGTKAYLALMLFLLLGQRVSDIRALGKQHIRESRHMSEEFRKIHPGRWLAFRQHKNRNRAPVDLIIPILPHLEEVLRVSPCGDMTFLVTSFGKPFTAKGLSNWFADRCAEAEVPGRGHGLRKAGATIAAENGATPHMLMAIFGWRTLEQAELYTKKVRQQLLAGGAMPLIVFGRIVNRSDPPQIEVAKSGSTTA